MNLEQVKPYLSRNVKVSFIDNQRLDGYLTNYAAELDDNDALVETVMLKPLNPQGTYYDLNINEIKSIEFLN
ncbi:hypothetical protein [Corticicoccus populi]|uniref:Uncharacterized protein n=1 Tax=Corticicoccus populi TaxID=1812821 RepID=A0ABW5WUP0_9STAP